MKTKLIMLAVFAVAATANAQSRSEDLSYDAQKARQFTQRNGVVLTQKPERPNEIRRKNFSYSGIAVQLAKADKPLQCINPLAPASYGSGEMNLVRNPATGHARGLKIFSIEF
jgi:hypothetical protein